MKKLIVILVVIVLVALALVAFVSSAEAKKLECHATPGADCLGWWVTIVGPGGDWILDKIEGVDKGLWAQGQTYVKYNVTAWYKFWKIEIVTKSVDRPYTPPTYNCEVYADIHGTMRNLSIFYDKPTGDEKHCHRIVWHKLDWLAQWTFKWWHGGIKVGVDDYNNHVPENPLANVVNPGGYGDCPKDYSVDPNNEAKCILVKDTSHWVYEKYTFKGKIDRPYCPCDKTKPIVEEPVWGPWVWTYNPETGLEEGVRFGTQTTYFVDANNPDKLCGTEVKELKETDTRKPEYDEPILFPDPSCTEWEYDVLAPEGVTYSLESGSLTGTWAGTFGPENNGAVVPTVKFTFPTGYTMTVTGEVIDKDEACIGCKITELYWMSTYWDAGAPDVYTKSVFELGPGICSIIHQKDVVPSIGVIQKNCSLCPDVTADGLGYLYTPDNMFLDERLLKIECWGKAVRYSYGGKDWPAAWVRENDFTSEGVRLTCRTEGCSDWIDAQVAK